MNPFFNSSERRPRAAIRLLAQGLLFFIPLTIFQGIIVFFALANLFSSGEIDFNSLGDPYSVTTLLTEKIMTKPGVDFLLSFSSLVVLIFSLWISARYLDRRPWRDYGLHLDRRWKVDFGFGLLLGAGLMTFIFVLEWLAGWVTVSGLFWSADSETPFAWSILISLLAFICVGIYEELLDRGYQLHNLAEGFNLPQLGPRLAILIASLLSALFFGSMHASNPNANSISTVFLVVAGLFLGLGYILTGELGLPIGLHIAWNFFQGRVFGFPVSGLPNTASFIAVQQGGPDLLTGGAFGPEAGLIGLLAMIVGSIAILVWVRLTRGKVELHLPLAEYAHKDTSQP